MLDAYMEEKVKIAIERLKLASEMSETYYHQPVVVTYSGGKDSDVVLALAEEAGIDFEVVMAITSVEAPQTMIHAHETARRVRAQGKKFTFKYSRDKDGKPLNMYDVVMQKKNDADTNCTILLLFSERECYFKQACCFGNKGGRIEQKSKKL